MALISTIRVVPLACVFVVTACSQITEFEIDKSADFSSFESFSVNAAETPEAHPEIPNHVDQAIAYQLTYKGLKRAPDDKASVNIRYFLTLDDSATAADSEDAEVRGELVVDVQDSQTGEVVWRGRSARELPNPSGNDGVMAQSVQIWVNDVLQEYPGR